MGWHLPWKKIGSGIKKGVQVAALFDPKMAAVAALIESVEHALPTSPGADKKATVMAGAMALIQSDLAGLTAEQRASIESAISTFVDSYVAVRNAIEAVKDAA